MCSMLCMCVWYMDLSVQLYRGQRTKLGVFFYHRLLCCLETGLLASQKHFILARLAGSSGSQVPLVPTLTNAGVVVTLDMPRLLSRC